jgi:hypothetical protein
MYAFRLRRQEPLHARSPAVTRDARSTSTSVEARGRAGLHTAARACKPSGLDSRDMLVARAHRVLQVATDVCLELFRSRHTLDALQDGRGSKLCDDGLIFSREIFVWTSQPAEHARAECRLPARRQRTLHAHARIAAEQASMIRRVRDGSNRRHRSVVIRGSSRCQHVVGAGGIVGRGATCSEVKGVSGGDRSPPAGVEGPSRSSCRPAERRPSEGCYDWSKLSASYRILATSGTSSADTACECSWLIR